MTADFFSDTHLNTKLCFMSKNAKYLDPAYQLRFFEANFEIIFTFRVFFRITSPEMEK